MKRFSGILLAAFAIFLLLPAAASAQTGYQLDNLSSSTVVPGGAVTVYVNGFKPDSTVTITLESDPVLLATVTAAANGVVETTVTIPSDTPPGTHTLVVRGVDRDDVAKVVSFPITVGDGGGSGGLPSTGGNIGLGLGVAAIAVGIGAMLLSSTRRGAATV